MADAIQRVESHHISKEVVTPDEATEKQTASTFSTWRTLIAKLEVDQSKTAAKGNDGNKPTPPEACTWGTWAFFSVLPWPAFSIAMWTSGSTLLSLGLTVGQAMAAAIVANTLMTILSIAAGHVGTKWRLSDPLDSRLAWGVRGYIFTLICQVAVATCWYAIQMVFGYLSVKVVIGALIPSFITMHNSFNSDKLPTNDFICLVIFLGVCLVLQYRPAHAWNTIGQIGGICTLITFIAITILCCVKAGGAGPLFDEPYSLVGFDTKPTSSQVVWGFFLAMSTKLANNGMLYEPNYTRFAKKFTSPLPAQIISHFFLEILVTLLGIISTSAAVQIFPDEGRLLWAPYELLLAFQKDGSAGARAGTFFAGVILVIPQLAMNITWNAYTTGINYSVIMPRWFTVRRGGYLTACLAVAVNPWNFATTPGSFARFLNGTAILYGSLCGMFIVDYYLVRKTRVNVSHLLTYNATSIYWYVGGRNWRAPIALLLAVWLPCPGWIQVIHDDTSLLAGVWQKLYGLSWMLCFFLSGFIYYILAQIWPMP